ncbi:hypothetical protein M408DRAFT_334327 [Serendipita vermifera MAFF 305830]|uniref:Uncharacterized protein n=1 Tax=Serendipita vermifera MAFF 305830 TaxID=933852 RepID=A0A0C3AK07_SERVB|nr:hypothetical protein M408DRAFT_334327 [Serendipita vermifera MAFF 305830]
MGLCGLPAARTRRPFHVSSGSTLNTKRQGNISGSSMKDVSTFPRLILVKITVLAGIVPIAMISH